MRGLNSIGGWLLSGVLCCGAYAAQDKPSVDKDKVPVPVAVEVIPVEVVPVTHGKGPAGVQVLMTNGKAAVAVPCDNEQSRPDQREMAQELQRRLNSDPLFAGTRVSIDLYGGLAIVHGSAPNENMILAVNTKLRNTEGVEVIYNYMTSPDILEGPEALRVTYEKFDRVDDVGVRNNSYLLAAHVEDRLLADPRLDGAGLNVDSYLGLIIVHGRVDTRRQAELVRDIAAYTDGVDHVISFVQVAGDPLLAPVTGVPVLDRSIMVDPFEPVRVNSQRRWEW